MTLVEVIVAVTIIGAMVGLLLTAVQAARSQAALAGDKNNVRQIMLGLHNYASQRDSRLPGRRVPGIAGKAPLTSNSPLFNIIPFVEGSLPYKHDDFGTRYPDVPAFLSPTDPSRRDDLGPTHGFTERGRSCYAVNDLVFGGSPTLTQSVPDGTSATIAVTQRYCLAWAARPGERNLCILTYLYVTNPPQPPNPDFAPGERCGTFADPMYLDVMPVVTPGQPTTASVPGATFQPRPSLEAAESRMLQSTHPSGLVAGMFDGSVRVYRSGVGENVFWAAVTPAAGDGGGGE